VIGLRLRMPPLYSQAALPECRPIIMLGSVGVRPVAVWTIRSGPMGWVGAADQMGEIGIRLYTTYRRQEKSNAGRPLQVVGKVGVSDVLRTGAAGSATDLPRISAKNPASRHAGSPPGDHRRA
jgi:hypothetical protein